MKRKMFRKLMAASLATAMVAGLAGCGDKGTSAPEESKATPAPSSSVQESSEPAATTSEEPVSKYTIMTDENGNPYDLGGMEFSVHSWFDKNLPATPYGDAVAEYREWAQETYNFTMTWDSSGGWGDFNNLGEWAMGGPEVLDNKYCAVMMPAGQGAVMAAIKEGLVWDLTELGVIDFSEYRFANNGVCDAYTYNGHVYAFEADYPEPRDGIWFNKELLEQTTGLTADYLYDLQKNNEWTWDKFKEICEMVYAGGDIDNDGNQDIYAIACNSGNFASFIASNGGKQMFDYVNGKYVNNSQDPAVVEAFSWFLDNVLHADYWYPQPEGTDWDYFYPAFDDEGKIVFLPEQAYHINGRLSVNDADGNAGTYGFLMFPIGPQAGGKYYNKMQDNPLIIPKCYNEEQAKKILLAYSLYFQDVPGYETYNYRLDDYESNVSDSRILDETLTRMMSEGVFVQAPGVPNINVGEDTGWFPADKTGAQMIDECQAKWQSDVDDANK